jgi:hypothetical protein
VSVVYVVDDSPSDLATTAPARRPGGGGAREAPDAAISAAVEAVLAHDR